MWQHLLKTGKLQELRGTSSTPQDYASSRVRYIAPIYQVSVMVPHVIPALSVNDLEQQGHKPCVEYVTCPTKLPPAFFTSETRVYLN